MSLMKWVTWYEQTLNTPDQRFLRRFMSSKRTHKIGTSTLNLDNRKKFLLSWIVASINVQNRFASHQISAVSNLTYSLWSSLNSHATQQLIIWQLLRDKQLRYAVFLRKMLGTQYGPVRTRFLWFKGPDFLWL